MVLGYQVAMHLGVNLNDFASPVQVYIPKRTNKTLVSLNNAFNSKGIMPSGVFSVQQDFDSKYVIVPLHFVRELMEYENEISGVEVLLDPLANTDKIQDDIISIVGDRFIVKNRFQQQELLYKIMKSEKLAIFIILSFILVIATFNVIGSLSMLILDKRRDIKILWSMGSGEKMIRRIFLSEGLLISLSGAILGLMLGGIICFLQQKYGLIRLGNNDGTFVVNAYPVEMQMLDFIYVFITVFIIGFGSAWFPVKRLSNRYIYSKNL